MELDGHGVERAASGVGEPVLERVPPLPLMMDLTPMTVDSSDWLFEWPDRESTIPTPPSSNTVSDAEAPGSSATTDKELFLGDLDHFIPVGALKYYDGAGCHGDTATDSVTRCPSSEVKNLESHGWIRTSVCNNGYYYGWSAVRVYVLPDDMGRNVVPRSSPSLRRALRLVMSKLDTSLEAWEGRFVPASEPTQEPEDVGESLFYIFNTLDSPEPDSEAISDPWASLAMEDLLWKGNDSTFESDENQTAARLKTPLYSYQRRSAALMVQKEVEPGQSLDPRLQCFEGPTGQQYYYDKEEGSIVREKRLYSNACGGILAETMGFGKTLICLSLILTTRGHFPRIPLSHIEGLHPVRDKTGTLADMAASTAGRSSVPWPRYFEQVEASGAHFERCRTTCERNRGTYTIERAPRLNRGTTNSQVKSTRIRLCSGTLVVAPSNLVDHWVHEIEKHTEGLEYFVIRDSRTSTPPADELLRYDIVLISRPRFDQESRSCAPNFRKAAYISSLQELHWLRIVVDEGHNFASTGQKSSAVHMLDNLHVERRWVVSGTPSSGLYGIEVSLAAEETESRPPVADEERARDILHARKDANKVLDEELKNLDKMRRIIVDFLKLKPWSNSRAYDPANWSKYIKPVGTDGKRKMSLSLRSTLQSIVVRHRAEHINRELTLPKLHNTVVSLEATFYDKLSLNLFIFQLAVNAITSERRDEDYMFHKKNRKYLSQLINNLRHAGFWWAGHKADKVGETLHVARKYMENNGQRMSDDDFELLDKAIRAGEKALESHAWNAFSKFNELGVFVHDFPDHARSMWSIDKCQEHQQPLLLGISQARLAQQFVTSNLRSEDPSEGIAGAGIRAKREMRDNADNTRRIAESGGSTDAKRNNFSLSKLSPKKPKRKPSKFISLPPESPLARTKIAATTSAKLTYLLEKVLQFQESEKIIIFYEHAPTAFWIAEGLEMLGVQFRIYSNALKASLKSKYLDTFNGGETVRVLLMDLYQAAHGLHVASASRVFIVDPIWDPNVESQAIKRAHRISQTRPVYVETLVLKDTLEDKMLRRRKEMTSAELQHAERDLLDDRTMSYIIQTEDFLPITEDESSAVPAYFVTDPPGFFDRHKLPVSDDDSRHGPPRHVIPNASSSHASTQPAPLSPSPPPEKPVNSKRKAQNDIPWIDSDVSSSPSPDNAPQKKRRSSDGKTVRQNGIVLVSPRSPTPCSRRGSTPSSRTDLGDGQKTLDNQLILQNLSKDGITTSGALAPNELPVLAFT